MATCVRGYGRTGPKLTLTCDLSGQSSMQIQILTFTRQPASGTVEWRAVSVAHEHYIGKVVVRPFYCSARAEVAEYLAATERKGSGGAVCNEVRNAQTSATTQW